MNDKATIRRAKALDPYRSAIGKLACILFLALIGGQQALAQGDREGERQSLRDVSGFSVGATVEGPELLTRSEALRAETLIRAARTALREADLPVAAAGDSAPTLHIHLNMMQLENGLIAFSVELDFFQEVVLARNRERASAVTWNESAVGLVSHDMTSTIAESVLARVGQFAEDFRTVN